MGSNTAGQHRAVGDPIPAVLSVLLFSGNAKVSMNTLHCVFLLSTSPYGEKGRPPSPLLAK
jgi:hypothetical protein